MALPTLLERRTLTLDTGKRTVEVPVDSLGRERYRAALDDESVEVRAAADDGSIGFKGHAAMFNKRTWIGPKKWGFWEQVASSAFDKTLKEADVRFLINHDPNLLLARNKAGTLRLSTDTKGLVTDADMAPVTYAQDLAVLLDRKDTTQMSFAFETIKDQWETLDDGDELRTLLEVKLWDVSVVTYPAYEETDAGLRGAAFDVLCRSLGIDDTKRGDLLRKIAEGEDLTLDEPEPPGSTRDDSQPPGSTGTPLELLKLRHRMAARKHGLPAA